jgi:hypothetical protein
MAVHPKYGFWSCRYTTTCSHNRHVKHRLFFTAALLLYGKCT